MPQKEKIQELLKKGASKQTSYSQNQFISNIFFRGRKDGVIGQ